MHGQHTHPHQWHRLREEIVTGMHAWWLPHPTATLSEIEAERDARLVRICIRILEDGALQRAATTWQEAPSGQQSLCPQGRTPLADCDRHQRQFQSHGGHALRLERSYSVCPTGQVGRLPLDEELALPCDLQR